MRKSPARSPNGSPTGPFPRGMEHHYGRPGFLLRRCHQISVSIFIELCADTGLTPAQYGVLYAIRENPGIDQVAVARALGFDRSTVSNVLERLTRAGLIERRTDSRDRRRRTLCVTRAGEEKLAAVAPAAAAAHGELLRPLASDERQQLLALLRKLVMAHSDRSRVPFDLEALIRAAADDASAGKTSGAVA